MSKFPVCVVIYLTDYCNLQCKHCFLTQSNYLNKNMIDYRVLEKQLRILKENNVFMIAYTGGDPILHPNLFKILKYTSELGMLPLLGISGVNISYDECKKIYDCGVRCVQIGLNGSNEEVNDYYRGKGKFKEILLTIDNLKKCGINVNVAFCLDKHNLFDLTNMLELANSLGVYKVKIEFWNCLSTQNTLELSEEEKDNVRKICDEYIEKNSKSEWILYPKSKANLTKIHSNALIIMPDGNVKKNEMGEALGNIYMNDINEIMEVKDEKKE